MHCGSRLGRWFDADSRDPANWSIWILTIPLLTSHQYQDPRLACQISAGARPCPARATDSSTGRGADGRGASSSNVTHGPISRAVDPHPSNTARPVSCEASDEGGRLDRKSTRLNSSHVAISYAVFCLKNKRSGH